ncbi:MAG TPA: FUSC family protein, partial [Trebonia sp.]
AERRQWYGTAGGAAAALGLLPGTVADSPRLSALAGATVVVARHATIRSVWFIGSLRGAFALAAAVAVADVFGVQHGFWVVLGTLSVLRTSAAATGATAWRALAGTVVGFVVGALLLLGIGTGQTALWVALAFAVLVAGYAPGTTPFLVGQAAFTVTIVVLFNLLVPVGWKVGLLRVEDVAIGCAVSLVVGVLFWPRGAGPVVANDLADSFRRGAEYLTQAVDWALSELMAPPSAAVAAVAAGIRLDDALRGFLTEQGSKKISKEDLWTLVNASMRLRLTADTLAGLRRVEPMAQDGQDRVVCPPLEGSGDYAGTPACAALRSAAAGLAGFYGQVADEVSHPGRPGTLSLIQAPTPLGPAIPRPNGAAARAPGSSGSPSSPGSPDGAASPGSSGDAASSGSSGDAFSLSHPHLLWVKEHLHHLGQSAQAISEPALRVAEARQHPWWR